MNEEPRVFGIKAPGEPEEGSLAYRIWYRVYRTIRIVRHRLGLHDFERRPLPSDDYYCPWCGAHAPVINNIRE